MSSAQTVLTPCAVTLVRPIRRKEKEPMVLISFQLQQAHVSTNALPKNI